MGKSPEICTEGFLHLSYRLTQLRNFVNISKEIFEISVTPRTNIRQVSLTLTWYQKSKISLHGMEEKIIYESILSKFKILRHWPFKAGYEKGRLLQENEKTRTGDEEFP
jgi:hypothetical protein